MSEHITREEQVENRIMRATIKALLDAGYFISVYDGGETTVRGSCNADDVFAAMKTTDGDVLNVSHPTRRQGWVQFVYGNEPGVVISDYTTNLEDVLAPVNAMAEGLEAA